LDAPESCRTNDPDAGIAIDMPDLASAACDGEARGEERPEPSPNAGILNAITAGESLPVDCFARLECPDAVGTARDEPCSGGMILGGRGNKGPCFFRRGSRKNVVVVWIVCVVVVVAYTPCSPDPSDLEDSDSLLTGRASVEPTSSPYAGGHIGVA
jgi:hypothetical protein